MSVLLCSVTHAGGATPDDIPGIDTPASPAQMLDCPTPVDALPLHRTPRTKLTPEQQAELGRKQEAAAARRIQEAQAVAQREAARLKEEQVARAEKAAVVAHKQEDMVINARQRQQAAQARQAEAKAEDKRKLQLLRQQQRKMEDAARCAFGCFAVCLFAACIFHISELQLQCTPQSPVIATASVFNPYLLAHRP